MSLEESIEKFALANAVKFNGRANQGSVISHVIAEHPDVKANMKDVAKAIGAKIKEINALGLEKQLEILTAKYPKMLEKKEHEEHDLFAFLKIPEGEIIKTAYPPGPEKYPHIGHAFAAIVNRELANKYGGKFVLRFEDTNPELVKNEFYDIIKDNLSWLGVKWDQLHYASEHMDLFFKFAEDVINSQNAYVCTCQVDLMRENRQKGIPCSCRTDTERDNLRLFRDMKGMAEGAAVLRLKIDLKHQNSTMRDPTIFRIIDAPHARQGNKYRVWPTYDWQNSIMDGYFQITHRLRSKEFEMRSELQRYIQTMLALKNTRTYEFARKNLEGVEASGRIIREKIEKGELIGWDDPSLPTIVALRRRGFTPEAIKSFVLSIGLTKSESTLTWDELIVHNKRVLDENADRFFFVKDPVKIKIEGAPAKKVELHRHPQHRRGGRFFDTHEDFYLSADDVNSFKPNELYRLMDCVNFTKKGKKFLFDSLEHEKYKSAGKKIMHYLPVQDGLVDVEVMMPDKAVVKGLGEPTMQNLTVGDIIQSERFGYIRLDSIEPKGEDKKVYKFWFTHN